MSELAREKLRKQMGEQRQRDETMNAGLMTGGWLSLKGALGYPVEEALPLLLPLVSDARRTNFQRVLSQRLTSLVLGIEDLYQNHNGAACLRSAEGLGIHRVIAAELRHPYPLPELHEGSEDDEAAKIEEAPPEIPRLISTSAHRWLDLHRVPSSEELIAWCRREGLAIYGAGPRGTLTLDEIPTDQPLCVLFGNERDGLRAETLEACDEVFRIPMYGFTESFNISVSVGMTLQHLGERRRRSLLESGRTGELSEELQGQLLAEWCLRDLRRGGETLLRRHLGPPRSLEP